MFLFRLQAVVFDAVSFACSFICVLNYLQLFMLPTYRQKYINIIIFGYFAEYFCRVHVRDFSFQNTIPSKKYKNCQSDVGIVMVSQRAKFMSISKRMTCIGLLSIESVSSCSFISIEL